MSSKGELLMQEVLARLTGSPALMLGADTVNVRRSHRIPVTRDDAPAAHVIDGPDTPASTANDCRTNRQKEFTVSGFIRDDAGAGAGDALIVEINRRLSPIENAYAGAALIQGPITPEEEIADGDAIRIDMRFTFEYSTVGWTLE